MRRITDYPQEPWYALLHFNIHVIYGAYDYGFRICYGCRKCTFAFANSECQMEPRILYRVIYGTEKPEGYLKNSLEIQPAILHDYCRHHVKHADYPGIVAEQGKSVRGTYATGLSDQDIRRLDQFEGSEYTRQKVIVELPTERNEQASTAEGETYVYTMGRGYLEDEEWSYEVFKKEKLHRWVGASVEYKGMAPSVDSNHNADRR